MDGSLTKKPESRLIGSSKTSRASSRCHLSSYILAKILPFMGYCLCSVLPPPAAIPVFLSALLFSFWIVKSRSGWSLIGIKWVIQRNETGGLISFESEPDPFIPNVAISNTFWIGFFVSLVLWAAVLFVSAMERRLLLLAFSVVGFGAEGINLVIFIKGHAAAQREAAQIARSAIFDDSIKFAIITDEKADGGEHQSDGAVE
jgi:hypothetical protein